MNPFHDSDEEYARDARDRAAEWPEPPEDYGRIGSDDEQERREEAENGPAS